MKNIAETSALQDYPMLPASLPEVTVPMAFANDYDGMLGETGRLPRGDEPVKGAMGLLLETAASGGFNLPQSTVLGVWRAAEESGGSFDALGTVKQNLSPDQFEEFCEQYRSNKPGVDLLYPDARPYLDALNSDPAVPNLALTYGDPAWQGLKTATADIPGHVEITAQKKKGPVIEGWRGQSGTFDLVATDSDSEPLALVRAESVTLVDDKPTSFDALPVDCQGVYLERWGETRKASQAGTVNPDQVRTMHGLDELQAMIESKLRPDHEAALSPEAAELLSRATQFIPVASFALRAVDA